MNCLVKEEEKKERRGKKERNERGRKETYKNRSFASLITLSSLIQDISMGPSPEALHSSSIVSFLFLDSDFIRVTNRAGSIPRIVAKKKEIRRKVRGS